MPEPENKRASLRDVPSIDALLRTDAARDRSFSDG
jgi:hypothetical protein